jgi:hypothetical protein
MCVGIGIGVVVARYSSLPNFMISRLQYPRMLVINPRVVDLVGEDHMHLAGETTLNLAV